jgi:hypothetical protein
MLTKLTLDASVQHLLNESRALYVEAKQARQQGLLRELLRTRPLQALLHKAALKSTDNLSKEKQEVLLRKIVALI